MNPQQNTFRTRHHAEVIAISKEAREMLGIKTSMQTLHQQLWTSPTSFGRTRAHTTTNPEGKEACKGPVCG